MPIQPKEGAVLIDAAQAGSSATREARATLEVSLQPAEPGSTGDHMTSVTSAGT